MVVSYHYYWARSYRLLRPNCLVNMEHAKKMVLLPQEALQKMRQEVEPKIRDPVSDLDSQMSEILKSNLDDREKWKNYQQILERFLYFAQASRKPISVLLKEEVSEAVKDDSKTLIDSSDSKIESILATIPVTVRKRAELLCQRLHSTSMINWNDKGEVSIDNSFIPGANIVDLINDIVRNRKHTNPRGWQQFAKVLHKLNIPQEFIGNTRRWTYIRSLNTDAAGSSIVEDSPIVESENRTENLTSNFAAERVRRRKKNLSVPVPRRALTFSAPGGTFTSWKTLRLSK